MKDQSLEVTRRFDLPHPLVEDIVRERCLPIIGAGFSKNAEIPEGRRMPDWVGLGDELADQTGYPSRTPLDAISAYDHEFGRARLIEEVRRLLHIDTAEPGQAHRAFCRLPFDFVCTTNVDFLLEKGYELEGRAYRAVVDQDQLATRATAPAVTVLKLHGDVNHPQQLVLTERDYDGFFEMNPLFATNLANLLIHRTALFIGYSLDDPDFRQIWQLIGNRLGQLRRKAYTVLRTPRQEDVSRFDRRGVRAVLLPGDDYNKGLTAMFDGVGEIWEQAASERSQYSDETVRQQMALPEGTRTRLCMVSAPLEQLSLYRDWVYPLARRRGFSPVSPADVVGADSRLAIRAAIIERCELIIADISSTVTVRHDLEMALLRDQRPQALVVTGPDQEEPPPPAGVDVLERGDVLLTGKDEPFVKAVDDWLAEASRDLLPALWPEPARLLEAGEERGAAIAALSLFEVVLRHVSTGQEGHSDAASGWSLTNLILLARRNGFLTDGEVAEIDKARTHRNRLVHLPHAEDAERIRKLVTRVVELTERVIERASASDMAIAVFGKAKEAKETRSERSASS